MVLSNYQGEEIIDSITIRQGKKYFDKKWMPRTVFNDTKGKDAYIIGNGESRNIFPIETLKNKLIHNLNVSEYFNFTQAYPAEVKLLSQFNTSLPLAKSIPIATPITFDPRT